MALSNLVLVEARGGHPRAGTGPAYAVAKGRRYRTTSRNAQEAHEAIRPTSLAREPEALGAASLGRDEARLYRLIWQRTLASQMTEKQLETTTVDLSDAGYDLRASATRTLFDGFSRVYTEGRDEGEEEAERTLPALAEGNPTTVADVTPTQHFTEPPPRFTEASLVKALEELGVGRPSTYAATLSTIVDRGYVTIRERRLYPEPVAEIVTDLLVEHFGRYVDLAFTARMEEELDEIARGERAWVPLLRAFYAPAPNTGRREAQGAPATRLHHRADRRGLLRGPPDGHPPGAQRAVPRLLALPGAQGVATAAGRGAGPADAPGGRRAVPRLRRDGRRASWRRSAAGSGRSSAATATRTAPTSRRTARRRRTSSRSR